MQLKNAINFKSAEMKIFNYYRVVFLISFIVLLAGSMLKVTDSEIGVFTGDNALIIGLGTSVLAVLLAFYLIFRSAKMPAGEKLIWVLLFSLGFIFRIGFIAFTAGLVFFFIGPKRLFYNKNSSGLREPL